jgi:predicted GNAT superfamily acetyltransferase
MAVQIRETEGMAEIREVTDLMALVWGHDLLDPGIARAIQHAGGYLTGAWDGRRIVGGSIAFLGRHGAELVLHSHATCTAPSLVGQGIGLALKWHQRRWTLDRGIQAIEWTYDPLVARNGWFNLTKLGARGVAYEVDFYGRMDTAIERGEESDRCFVRWELDDPKVVAAAAGDLDVPDLGAMQASGVPVVVDVGPEGQPVTGEVPEGGPALAHLPADIESLRLANPQLAGAWRRAVRDTVGAAMQAGRHLTAATRDGWYLLEPMANSTPFAAGFGPLSRRGGEIS